MSAGSRRADGRARMLPTGVETLGIVFDLVLLVVLVGLGLDMVGITAPFAVLANATVVAFVLAGVLTVASLVVENVKEARTGAHSANRREEVVPEVTRDVLSEALAAIEESDRKFRDEHPEVLLTPPADGVVEEEPIEDTTDVDLPGFAQPVTRIPQPVR